MRQAAVPAGHVRVDVGRARAVARHEHAAAVRAALSARVGESLHAWAGAQPNARALRGRGIAWAVALPDGGPRVVVRHNAHGGLLAPLTGDRFLAPTRAPFELAASLRLHDMGIETPEVVAYVAYPAGALGLLARSDVATLEVPSARDLGELLLATTPHAVERTAALAAAARLVDALAVAGARHHDLNVKNVLLAGDPAAPRAVLLDVDRVTFHRPADARVRSANLARLLRSVRKFERLHGARIDGPELAVFGVAAV